MPPTLRPAGRWFPLPLLLLLLLLLLLAPARVHAQAPSACDAPEHRQFDFWIGRWKVTNPKGDIVGTSRIERTLNGCVLQEFWSGSKGGAGTSLNLWSAADRRWRQVWADDSGTLLELSGGLEARAMVLRGVHPTPGVPGGTTTERITWTPLEGGTVRQHWESSTDGGGTWTTQFDGLYTRAP
jgi:hypothetical protein